MTDARDVVFVAPSQNGPIHLAIVMREADLEPGKGAEEGGPGVVSSIGYALLAFTAEELSRGNVRVPS